MGGDIAYVNIRLASCVEELPLASHSAQRLLCVSGAGGAASELLSTNDKYRQGKVNYGLTPH